eukprot:CCRYP_001565-RA/>CCRYP_001565-RA protein AED:0.44 eAED:0.44 QI:0/0/0/1/0/0/2/0/147
MTFQHASITNLTLSPADKIMQAIADCVATLKGITSLSKEIGQLHSLLSHTSTLFLPTTTPSLPPDPMVNTPNTPTPARVPTDNCPLPRTTRSMSSLSPAPTTLFVHPHAHTPSATHAPVLTPNTTSTATPPPSLAYLPPPTAPGPNL